MHVTDITEEEDGKEVVAEMAAAKEWEWAIHLLRMATVEVESRVEEK